MTIHYKVKSHTRYSHMGSTRTGPSLAVCNACHHHKTTHQVNSSERVISYAKIKLQFPESQLVTIPCLPRRVVTQFFLPSFERCPAGKATPEACQIVPVCLHQAPKSDRNSRQCAN